MKNVILISLIAHVSIQSGMCIVGRKQPDLSCLSPLTSTTREQMSLRTEPKLLQPLHRQPALGSRGLPGPAWEGWMVSVWRRKLKGVLTSANFTINYLRWLGKEQKRGFEIYFLCFSLIAVLVSSNQATPFTYLSIHNILQKPCRFLTWAAVIFTSLY